MRRRKLVALVAASVLGTLAVVVIATLFFVTQTTAGHERVRGFVQPLLAGLAKGGDVYIGRLSGNLVNQVTVDSFAIRDKRGDLLVSTGRVSVAYNPRDLADYRILVRRARVEHPYVHLIQHENGVWNFKEIFAKTGPSTPKNEARRSLGDYIVLDSVTLRDATFLLTQPWHPDDSLRGPVRDSVIRAHLTNPERAVAKTPDGYARTYAWRSIKGLLSHVRLADPDSDEKYGQEFRVASLSADEFEPTFKFRNVTANVHRLADTLSLDVPHFDMPASTGHAKGRIWWGGGLSTRYDIAIRGDSVSLDDVNWVYPDLPRSGGGTLNLAIQNDPKNLHVIDFKITNMDVKSTKSHLTGAMSFGTGASVLLVRNVDLRADPVDFDLLRTFNGKPFAEDWQGQLIGTVKGRGGPLTHFVVDDLRARFEDAHVRGAVSSLTGKGELDILKPAYTAFHGFDVNAGAVNLRTIEFLFPSFPRLGGTVSGTARLDSSWLDVRFSNADLTHHDGPGEPSRITGSGRITYGEPFMIYDVALNAEPLSFTTLARSYPGLPIRGIASGPIHAKGSSPDLELVASLEGAAGKFSFDGRIDIDTIGGIGAHGRGEFATLNLGGLLEKPSIPKGTFSGHYELDVAGATPSTLQGSANLDLERTTIDSVRVYPSYARLRFADGRLLVDSLRLHTAVATLFATGGIGLPKGKADSLQLRVVMDSLGGVRPLLPRRDTTVIATAASVIDSLAGRVEFQGWARGTLDTLGVRGTVTGTDFYFNGTSAHGFIGNLDLQNVLKAPTGVMRLSVDSAVLSGVALDSIGGTLRADQPTHATFTLGALSHSGPTVSAGGIWNRDADSNAVLLETANLSTSAGTWRLAAPAHVVRDKAGIRIDSLLVRNGDSAVVTLSANVPDTGAASLRLRGSRLPLQDFALAAQLVDSVGGIGDVDVFVTGTKLRPLLTGNALITGVKRNGVELERIASSVRMDDRHASVNLAVIRQGDSALVGNVNLPVDFRLFGLKLRNDSISGRVRADTTDLSILQLASRNLKNVSGKLIGDLSVFGTLHPILLRGSVRIVDGSAAVPPLGNITLKNISGGISGAASTSGQDSIAVALSALSDGGIIGVNGWVKNSGQKNAPPSFHLAVGANDFHAFNKRSLADLVVSTTDSLRLTGDLNRPVLAGALFVDRGSIFLPDRDIARKQTTDLFIDTITTEAGTGLSSLAAFEKLRTNLQIPSLTVRLADNEVRLRSAEANVRLAGALQVVKSAGSTRVYASRTETLPGLGVEGMLQTVGGTYNLNLGVVQREFQVLSGGTVTFNGAPDNPTLNIFAQYNVKQYRDRDLEIRVNLHGPLIPYPQIDFSSNADYISTSDLLSYLLTGRPGFDFASNSNTQQVVASFLAPTVSAYTADRLRRSFGSVFDAFRFELGSASNAQTAGTAQAGSLGLRGYFYGATIGAEKQFANNLFLSVNTGLCQFDPQYTSSTPFNPLNNLGAKVEYRFKPTLSGQLTYDPSTLARTCSPGQTFFGVVPTPPQFGFSLSHTWRF
ncbi:MAG TPA: translocation/assembly module TamB domain-containing protein [Gemmatimonadaceae bacterium]|nr:translocation/assembly module TamB domain-containing protein [Gemmatimonadaceae bacterium]